MAIKHVKPFDPVWTVLEEPSGCGIVIVALFTTDAGAAVFTLAMYLVLSSGFPRLEEPMPTC